MLGVPGHTCHSFFFFFFFLCFSLTWGQVTALRQSKMKYIRDALLALPEGGWLLWLDADLAILRHDVSCYYFYFKLPSPLRLPGA